MKKITVVLADDHAMVREGICRILEETKDISVIGHADNGVDAVRLAQQVEPDVLILDFTMPKLDGLGVTERVRNLLPDTKILILTIHDNIQFAVRILEAGAHGFLLKEEAPNELIQAVRGVNTGKIPVSPKMMEKLTAQLRRGEKGNTGLDSLSSREFELLRHLGSGKSIRDSAKSMYISESTASTYRGRLLEKLSLKTTGDLIKFALENDLVG